MKSTHRFLSRCATWPLAAAIVFLSLPGRSASAEWVDIGSRRELFVDEYLVERLVGNAELRMHHPTPQQIAIDHNEPWEGPGSGYHSIFKDGDLYRMYYKAWQLTVSPGQSKTQPRPLFCCYAESDDGVHWRKPVLGLHEFNGSKENNIVFARVPGLNADPGHPAVFKDENPHAAPDARYKAILVSSRPRGMVPFKSPDGIHWTPISRTPVITDGAFDSQNLAFWDSVRSEYRAYWRYFTEGTPDAPYVGERQIRTAVSKDFIHWEQAQNLRYADSPVEQLYTNVIKPYHRAPHLLIGFPIRYIDRGWSESTRSLPEREHREFRASANRRYGTALTEGLLMASRDGVTFKRWPEAFLRPGIEREGTWNYGHQAIGWHLVETRSALEGAPNELSLYAVESYWTGDSSVLRRYTLRLDGFVSASAPMKGGELITKPVRFQGRELRINFSTSAAGSVRVELQDAEGRVLPGFSIDDCEDVFGDAIERRVIWKGSGDVSAIANQPVRLRFVLKDADVYAFQFVE